MVRTISKFSGKCDVYDWISSPSTHVSNLTIYVGDSKEPLKIDYLTDIIPYYPFIVSMGYHNNETKEDVLRITSKSYVDIREEERLNNLLDNIKSIYKFCRKCHELFLVDKIVEKYNSYDFETEQIIREICARVERDGENATIDGIHLKICEYYREELYKEMIESGVYTEEEARKWIWK